MLPLQYPYHHSFSYLSQYNRSLPVLMQLQSLHNQLPVHPLSLQTLCSLLRLPASDYILALAYIHTLLPTMEHQIRSATYRQQ